MGPNLPGAVFLAKDPRPQGHLCISIGTVKGAEGALTTLPIIESWFFFSHERAIVTWKQHNLYICHILRACIYYFHNEKKVKWAQFNILSCEVPGKSLKCLWSSKLSNDTFRSVNKHLLSTYWWPGTSGTERHNFGQHFREYGSSVLAKLLWGIHSRPLMRVSKNGARGMSHLNYAP